MSALPTKSQDDRLTDLLHEWGDWKNAWSNRTDSAAMISPVFRGVRSGYQTCTELLSPSMADLIRATDSAINDLLGRGLRRQWIVIHWEYAPPVDHRRGARVWSANGLPPLGSAGYVELLNAARAEVLRGLITREKIV